MVGRSALVAWDQHQREVDLAAPVLPHEVILRGTHPFGKDQVRYFVNPQSAAWTGHAPAPTLALPLPA